LKYYDEQKLDHNYLSHLNYQDEYFPRQFQLKYDPQDDYII